MKDKELIQALRCCGSTNEDACKGCPVKKECHENIGNPAASAAADRLEALLAENERLKAQLPKWVSVEEKLPEESGLYFTLSTEGPKRWIDNFDTSLGKFGAWWDYEPDGTKHPNYRFIEAENITHWMPIPEPPSTEGVE